MKAKRLLALLLSVLLVVSCLPVVLADEAPAAEPTSGECGVDGDNVKWKLEDGKLTVYGTGAIRDYYYFSEYPSIRTIEIQDGITHIGNLVFFDCRYAESVSLPKTLKTFGTAVFQRCDALKSITIPGSMTKIASGAFALCPSLQTVKIEKGVQVIGNSAFGMCDVRSISIPDTVTTIEDMAFFINHNLKNVTIPDSMKTIGEDAFVDCPAMKAVTIPKSVTAIGKTAFGYYYSDGVTYKVPGFTISGYTGTAAEKYAKENGFTFKALNAPTTLSTPKITSVKANSATSVTVKWGKVTGAAKYRVFYKTTGGWKKLADTASTSYTWKSAKAGTKYSFTVRCLDKNGKYVSAYNKTGKSVTTPKMASTALSTPKVSSVTKSGTKITVKWGKITGAAKYRVFYKTDLTGSWKKLTDTTKTSYTWSKGKTGHTYSFTVRCLNKSGKYASSYDTTGKSVTLGNLKTPSVKVENVNGGLKVSWNKITGAEKYRVFRKSGNSWKKVKDTTGTSVTLTNGTVGKKYTYTVRCISADGKKYTSKYNTKGVSGTFYKLETPKITKVNLSSGYPCIWFERVEGAEAYRLFYKTGSGSWTKLKKIYPPSADSPGANFKFIGWDWEGAKKGTTYTFTVRCVSADGKKYTSAYDTKGVTIKF